MITVRDIATYVVNLPRRQDRRAWIHASLPDDLTVTYTSDFDRSFDGRHLTLADLEADGIELFDWQIDSSNSWWNRPLKFGEIGCTLAHLACWSHAADHTDQPYVLVLEDDAVLGTAFTENLLHGLNRLRQEAAPFELLYLGRYPLEPDRQAAVPGFVVPGYSHCSYAYLFTRTALATLLAVGLRQAIVPVDEFLPALYVPHPREDLRTRFPPQLTALAFDPPLVTQRPKEVAGSDTEDSGFVDTSAHSGA
ncbi:glycosyltransferase family 25 protein [Nocardia sp. alder85J]|uniref:glycosyltransferase family 25 protein n=1 Tax=Nocardia sp. alder85J TaxID=2862949 RepID=UPI001CD78C3F|nr:glycosyltransferase family 25 protein [Nocardia sp. alder85J]MCX4099084.1 glycosyltransferase family 25 protein [Nocardia sp. alder85J]